MASLKDEFTFSNGITVHNRITKVAMSEGLAPQHIPSEALIRLYEVWSRSGAGLLLTGNIQVNRLHLERADNAVLDQLTTEADKQHFRTWTTAAKQHGAKVVAQLNHTGRATLAGLNPKPLSVSSIELKMPTVKFGVPVTMTAAQIEQTIQEFALAAQLAVEVGFDGVEIHAAHGYLISQFLSPKVNQRQDQWGGNLDNRMRFLLEIVRAVQAVVPASFLLGVKLNASDFEKGGFDVEDAQKVAAALDQLGVHFLEVSGGSIESLKMVSANENNDSPYFLTHAKRIREQVQMPIILTGGIRRRPTMDEILGAKQADLIGLARPFCINTRIGHDLIDEKIETLPAPENNLSLFGLALLGQCSPLPVLKKLNIWATQNWFSLQMKAIGTSGQPDLDLSLLQALRAYKKWEERSVQLRNEQLEAV